MKFRTSEHEKAYYSLLKRMGVSDKIDKIKDDSGDIYRLVLAYLLTLDTECCKHIDQLYDFEDRFIELTALERGWQTSTSLKTTLLAFNLFTCGTSWCSDKYVRYCSVSDIFCCSYAPYYWEAIKLLYPEYVS